MYNRINGIKNQVSTALQPGNLKSSCSLNIPPSLSPACRMQELEISKSTCEVEALLPSVRHATDAEIIRFVDAGALASLRMNKQPSVVVMPTLATKLSFGQKGSSSRLPVELAVRDRDLENLGILAPSRRSLRSTDQSFKRVVIKKLLWAGDIRSALMSLFCNGTGRTSTVRPKHTSYLHSTFPELHNCVTGDTTWINSRIPHIRVGGNCKNTRSQPRNESPPPISSP
jgi:hypothetical protein